MSSLHELQPQWITKFGGPPRVTEMTGYCYPAIREVKFDGEIVKCLISPNVVRVFTFPKHPDSNIIYRDVQGAEINYDPITSKILYWNPNNSQDFPKRPWYSI